MDYSKESQDRMKKIQDLKDAGVICYANNYTGKQDIFEVQKWNPQDLEKLTEWELSNVYQTAGRIISLKSHGKLAFAKIRDHSGTIQICFMRDVVKFHTGREVVQKITVVWEEKTSYKIAEKFTQVGDYIGVKWDLFETKHGELTLLVDEFQILSKAIRPLPEKWHGVTDQETIYRQRYLDLIMNDESFGRFNLRSKFIESLRDFYKKHSFVEIETPVLGNAASGAAAQPFITHHNDFDEDFFLRIAPETALKKATVGRFERVVEFTRNFRNEGSDPSHMQEFSAIEHYAAWWNFEDNMKFTEDMFDHLFDTIPELSRQVEVKDKDGNIKTVDFTTPWKRIDYIAGVQEKSGIDISKYWPQDESELRKAIKDAGHNWEWIDQQVTATMIDYLYKKVLRPGITWPAFVYNYPKTMQPLARQSDENEDIVEQFQMVVNGWEVLKAYSELVDPKVQVANFEAQGDALEKWDEEATSSDDDFVLAMEYGMPPQSGWGMWVERILTLLTGQDNLRDMVLFPLMKTDTNESKKWATNLAVALINTEAKLEKWQELNTIAHLSASFASRQWKGLLMQDSVESSDGESIKLNIQDAIMIKSIDDRSAIDELLSEAKKQGITISEFTREMIETSDDKKVAEITKSKKYDDLEYLGVLLYGEKKQVERLTKQFPLYG